MAFFAGVTLQLFGPIALVYGFGLGVVVYGGSALFAEWQDRRNEMWRDRRRVRGATWLSMIGLILSLLWWGIKSCVTIGTG